MSVCESSAPGELSPRGLSDESTFKRIAGAVSRAIK